MIHCFLILMCIVSSVSSARTHIIVMLADDLGWNEVSWHNPRYLTPHLHNLNTKGVSLLQSYVTPKCSPSRAALMTGMDHYNRIKHSSFIVRLLSLEDWSSEGSNREVSAGRSEHQYQDTAPVSSGGRLQHSYSG